MSPSGGQGLSLQDQKNLKAFAKQAVLIAGSTVDHEAANN